jgi:developmental checkpoint coupling sporulation initiation to replication initiation
MEMLSDELLVDAYHMAIKIHLDAEFISLLAAEIRRRQINPDNFRITA